MAAEPILVRAFSDLINDLPTRPRSGFYSRKTACAMNYGENLNVPSPDAINQAIAFH